VSTINDIKQMEKTKRCPYCGEEILESAIKCKHCGEWLEKKDSGKMPVNRKISNWFKDHFWQTVIPFLLLVGFLGFKHYLLYKKNHAPLQAIKGWEFLNESRKADEAKALHLLTKSPWLGKNTTNNSMEIDGWDCTITQTLNTEKSYTNEMTFFENGIITVNITASLSDNVWEADGIIDWKESGEIVHLYGSQELTERMKSCTGEILEIMVKRNYTTEASDDEIAEYVRNILTKFIRNAQESDETSTYQIEDLTDTTFVLKGGTILEPTGERLVYKRK